MLSLAFVYCLSLVFCTNNFVLGTQSHLLGTLLTSKKCTIEDGLLSYFDRNVAKLHINAYFENYTYWGTEFSDVQTAFLTKYSNISYILNVQYEKLQRPYRYNLCYVDTLKAFYQILPNAHQHHGSTTDYYIIILKQLRNSKKLLSLIREMLKILYNRNVINAIAVVDDPLRDGDYLIYTSKIFKAESCRSSQLSLINTFRNGKFQNERIFPEKLGNLEQCPLRISVQLFDPYFMYDNETRTVTGVEAEMLKVIAEKMNFSSNFIAIYDGLSSDVYANGSCTGGFLDLIDRNADVLLGGKSFFGERIIHFANSHSYLVTQLVNVRLLSDRRANNLLWPVKSFTVGTWMGIIGLLFIGIILVKLASSLPNETYNSELRRCSWMHVLSSMLGGTILKRIRRLNSVVRCGIIIWCLGFTIFYAAFNARLYIARHQRPPRSVKSIEDLISRKYTFILGKYQKHIFVTPTINRIWQTEYDSPVDTYNILLNTSGQFALIANQPNLMYYIRSRRLTDAFDILPKPFFIYTNCMYFQPNSFLIKPFNEIIHTIQSSGLLVKWMNDVQFKLLLMENRKRKYREATGIGIKIIYPVFVIMTVCYLISILVFLMELYMART